MLTLLVCGLTASVSEPAWAAGYLPLVGPTPLRFEPPPSAQSQPARRLPSLAQLVHPAPPPAAAVTNAPEPAPTETGPGLPEPPATGLPRPQLNLGPELPPLTSRNQSAPDMGLNPQVILGYLVPLTTNAPAGQFQPPIFVPPQAPEPPSSRATYESR